MVVNKKIEGGGLLFNVGGVLPHGVVNSKAVRQTKVHLTLRAPVLGLPPLLCNIILVPVVAHTAVTLSMKIVWHAPCCQAIVIRGGHDPGDLLLGMSQHLLD